MATERYPTPDGLLELLVAREDRDVNIGFDGYSWHTHGDVLIGEYALIGVRIESVDQAVERFLSNLRDDFLPIIVYRSRGRFTTFAYRSASRRKTSI